MTMATNLDSVINTYQFQFGFLKHMLLTDIDEADRATQPLSGEYKLKNHPAWQIGHMAVASDSILVILGEERQFDDEFRQRFGRGSQPVAVLDQYPTLINLMSLLSEAHDRVITALDTVSEERLSSPNPMEDFAESLPTIRDMTVFMMATHESIHLGQFSVWRKAMGLPTLVS